MSDRKIIVEKDPAKGTGKKPKGSKRRLYTDENPKDTVSVKFRTVQDIKDTLSKKSFKSKSHKRQSQIINLIHQRSRAAYKNAKDPKVKARLKKAFDYATKRKEASKKKTERMKKLKEELIDKLIDEEINLFLEKRKLTKKPSSETSLRDWFKRKGAKGKKGGWVDCNAPDGKGGYKACGRTKGEKRKKYPACRPTPAACRSRGKGKKWGKKSKKSK
jgi:lysyl-tRNA synthetase class I